MNLLLPKGAEITRDTPPGHFNAIFLNDVNPLDTKELADAIKQANEQKAFVFWNHQGWKGPEKGQWLDIHTTLYDNKWLHGMEVCNGDTYYPDAHAWCLQRNLTMLGDSDIHEPERKEESAPGDHRTMTLVFAKDRTLEGVKEALTERRTAVWFQDQVIGRQELLEPLFRECVRVARPHLRSKNALWVEIRNVSDVNIVLQQSGSPGPSELKLPAGAVSLVKIDVDASTEPAVLSYTAANFLIAPNQGLPVTLPIAK
jgi:hypothetical protein